MKILIAENREFSREALSILESIDNVEIISKNLNKDELKLYAKDADVLWIRLKNYISADILENSKIKYIVTATTGLNCIDLQYTKLKKIKVLSLKGEEKFLQGIRATPEFTIASMLALLRNIKDSSNSISKYSWDRERFKGNEIFGKTVGIIGYGRVGRLVAKYLNCFGANILVCEKKEKKLPKYIKKVNLEEIFKESDIVTLHINYENENKNIINKKIFDQIDKPIYFINTARGELVNEHDLVQAIKENKIIKAAIDVLNNEVKDEIENNELLKFAINSNKILLTPHLGGCTKESMEKTEVFMAKKLKKELVKE